MIDLKVKGLFFDRQRVMRAVDSAKRKALSKSAGAIRLIARRSIRKRPGASLPGQPPHSHRGLLRNWILYSYDKHADSAVVGPALIARGTGAPATLEHGGRAHLRRRRKKLRIGNRGIIRVGAGGRDRRVQRATLETQAQVARAETLTEQIYGPTRGTFTIVPRPYMGPALRKEIPNMPARWRNSIREG